MSLCYLLNAGTATASNGQVLLGTEYPRFFNLKGCLPVPLNRAVVLLIVGTLSMANGHSGEVSSYSFIFLLLAPDTPFCAVSVTF